MKQAEREDTWARVNAQAESVFKDDESMKGFLNFMANCTPQSTRNLLILYEQNTEITHPRTFDKWKEAGRSIRSGEKGYTFFADQEYTKEDGTIANGYTITKAYDISQTRGPQPLPPQQHLPEEIIATIERTGLSRFPVYEEDIDDIIGILHFRDAMALAAQLRKAAARSAERAVNATRKEER